MPQLDFFIFFDEAFTTFLFFFYFYYVFSFIFIPLLFKAKFYLNFINRTFFYKNVFNASIFVFTTRAVYETKYLSKNLKI